MGKSSGFIGSGFKVKLVSGVRLQAGKGRLFEGQSRGMTIGHHGTLKASQKVTLNP